MIFSYKNNARRLGHMPRTLPSTRSPAALPRAADLARFAFAAKAFPQARRLQHRLLVRVEVSVGPTCFCRVGSSVSQQRKPERIGILIQAERAINVGLRMFNADGRRLEDSRMLWPLLAQHLDAPASLEWFCEVGSNVGACVESGCGL